MGWWNSAACKKSDLDPEIFFVDEKYITKVRQAKAVCRTCPVRIDCYQEGLTTGSPGIFGGTTLTERRTMKALGIDFSKRIVLAVAPIPNS